MRHLFLKRLQGPIVSAATLLFLASSGAAATPTDLTLRVTAASFRVGREGRYAVTVANRGNQPTDADINVIITLPDGLSFVAERGSAWTCSATGLSVDCVRPLSLPAGRTSTFLLTVAACTDAFPSVTTTFDVEYAADSNPINNVATRTTAVRTGQCVAAGTPTPAGSVIASATKTPAPPGTPTATPAPGNPNAPLVTSFTCNGAAQCTVSLGASFVLQFTFTDANANAISWQMTSRRDDGFTSDAGSENLGTPTGHDTVVLQFPPFTCSTSPCRQATFVFSVVVTDTSGLKSTPATLPIIVRASGQ